MKKQNKIISLILVVAMLMSMLVVVMPAASASSETEVVEEFAPTASFEQQEVSSSALTSTGRTNVKNAALATGVDGNILNNFYGAKFDPFNAYVVTEGEDSYVMFNPVATGVYGTDAQFLFQSSSTLTAITDWYVAEFDVASEAAFPNGFYVCLPMRDSSGSGTATFSPSVTIGNYVEADGDWHRVTIIGDLESNKMYLYIDGELALDSLKASNADLSNYTDGLTHTGLKFSNDSTLEGTYGETVYLDNVATRVVTGDDITALSAAVTSGDITSWAGYTSAKEGSLPAMISVDGVEYSSSEDANEALASLLPVEAEVLRDFIAPVTVNCDAAVNTNGCSVNITAGTDVTVTNDGNVYTYDAPAKCSVTETAYTTSASTATAAIKNATHVSGTSYIQSSGNYGDTGVIPYVVTDTVTGDQYLDFRSGATEEKTTAHQHMNWITANTTYTAGTYFITEFDVYVESEIMQDLYIGITSRNSSGTNKGGGSMYPKAWNIPVGEWAHITWVGDVDTNTVYVYVNNTLAQTRTAGLYGSSTIEDGAYFQGIRVNVNTMTNLTSAQNFAIDNVSYTMNLADTWLDNNIGATSIAAWPANNYTSAYEFTSVPIIATVDGEVYNSVAAIERELTGNNYRTVEFYRGVLGDVTVACDATVNTNGYAVNLVAAEGVTVSNEGNVYTYDAPFMKASTVTTTETNSTILAATKSGVAGNLYYTFQNNVTMTTHGVLSEIIENNVHGGDYLRVQNPSDVEDPSNSSSGTNNSYFEMQAMVQLTPNDNTQYIVVDFDAAVLSDVAVGLSPVSRGNGSTGLWGANNVNLSTLLAAYDRGVLQHITVVLDFDANVGYYFINGAHYKTCANGVTSATNHTDYWGAGTMVRFDGLRVGADLADNGGYILENIAIRSIEDDATDYAGDSLTAALAANTIALWSDSITETATNVAPVATVNGEYVYTGAQLAKALSTGINTKDVAIIDDIADTITVNANAVIETNGVEVTFANATDVTSSTDGTVITFTAPWMASATETAVSSADFIIDSAVKGNLFTGRTGTKMVNNSAGEVALYQVTDNDTGNTYVKLQPTINGALSSNVYLTTEIISESSSTSDACVLQDGVGYYVYDLDIATEGVLIDEMSVAPSARNQASESGTFPFPSSVGLSDYNFSDGEWMHMTIIGDMAANVQYVYINGDYAGTAGVANAKAGQYDYINVKGYRMNLVAAAVVSTEQSVLLDNISCRVYKSADLAFGLDEAIASGTIANWSENIYESNEKLPAIATVNGVRYSGLNELESVLSDGKDNEISLEKSFNATVEASATATIDANGFANFIVGAPGYNVVDNGDGTYSVVIETRMGSITVNINGNSSVYADVLYGTDIAEYLRLNNSYVFDIVSDDDGQVYTGAAWDVTPAGYVDGDEVYNVTATAFENAILILDATTGEVVNEDATFDEAKGTASSNNYAVFLNADVTTEKTNIQPMGYVTFYMAGHSIISGEGSSGSHTFNLDYYAKEISFVNGSVIDMTKSLTNALFYAAYPFAGEIAFVNCDVVSVATIGTIRGGTFTFENCNINVPELQNTCAFSLTEYYNAGYTYNKCTLNLIDTDISFKHFSGDRSATFATIKDISEWSGTPSDEDKAAAVAKGADTLIHEINVSGCNVNVSFGAGFLNSTTENVEINVDNSVLNVKKLYNTMSSTINIGDNVLSGISFADDAGVTFGKGVVAVNSGNSKAPYAYVNEYATVTWSDGTVELWLDGSVPANSACKTDAVCKVESGNSYTFEAVDGFALTMKANMTLDANLKFNVYVPTSSAVTGVQIADVAYDVASATVVTVGGVECYMFVYEIAPYEAAANFAIVLTTADYTVAREIGLVEYADLVAQAYADDANAVNLVKAILEYVAAAHKYMANYVDGYTAALGYANADEVIVDTSAAVNTMSNVTAYIKSAQLNLSAAPMWRFNLVDGADITGLTITVNGETVEYVIGDGYIEFELPAYDMCDTITVTVGEVSGEYNFAAYYAAQAELANSIDPSTTSWRANANIDEAIAYYNISLLDAFYTYTYYAAAYNA